MKRSLTYYRRRLEKKGYENFINSDCINISRPEIGYNPAVLGRLGSNFPLPPSMKVSFIYDDQDKVSHRVIALVPG